jgi:hypothetical protein
MKRKIMVIQTDNNGERVLHEYGVRSNTPLTRKESLIVNTVGLSGLSTFVSGMMLLNGVITR